MQFLHYLFAVAHWNDREFKQLGVMRPGWLHTSEKMVPVLGTIFVRGLKWLAKELTSVLFGLGVYAIWHKITQSGILGKDLKMAASAATAPLWFIGAGLLGGLVWILWPAIGDWFRRKPEATMATSASGALAIGQITGPVNIFQNTASTDSKAETPPALPDSSASASFVNPLDADFEKKIVRLVDLVEEVLTPIIRGKVFKSCRIVGPAMVHLDATNLISNQFTSNPDRLFVASDQEGAEGVILLQNCTFESCQFKGIGIIGPSAYIKGIKRGFGIDE